MALHLFAGLRVRDFQAAQSWYERLLGEPTFFPHATEAVWTLAAGRARTPTASSPVATPRRHRARQHKGSWRPG
jgi:hypothetical protein